MIDLNKKICIIGLGLIGGGYAEALTKAGYEVCGIARREETVEYALSHGFIKEGRVDVTPDFIGRFDILVFALYPHTFKEWIEKYQSYIKPGALITDVTGVKCCIVYDIQNILRPDVEFIAAHPMAGRESSGIENATMEVFKGANYIVTPTEKNTEEAIDDCMELGRILGFKTVTTLTPEKHDEMIAFLSQLSHCIAVSLMTCRDTEALSVYSGDSFRDLTRIAKINDVMWSELFSLNSEELIRQMDMFIKQFNILRDMIAQDDKEGMRELMRLSTSKRVHFDRKED